jgi:MFS transporter, YNFM family, putative membrane transport protein
MPLLLILSAASFISAFTIQLINPLVPAIAREFGISVEQAAMLASGFTLSYAASQLVLGPLGDALGKARVIQVCLAVLVLGLLLSAFATSFEYLFAARMLAGVAGGGIIPVGFAIVGDRFPMETRQVALARLVMAAQLAILIGAMTGGLVAERIGWRYVFIAPAIIGLVITILAFLSLKPRADAVRTPMSLARSKAGYVEALTGPYAALTLGGVLFSGMTMFGLMPFIAGRLEARGLGTLTQAGLVISGIGVGGLLFTIFVKVLLERLGRSNLVKFGGMIAFAGFLAAAFSTHWIGEMLAFVVTGFGYFMVHNSLQTTATELAPNARGSGVAMFACILFTAQGLGPILYRALFSTLGQNWPIVIGGLILLVVSQIIARRLAAIDGQHISKPI